MRTINRIVIHCTATSHNATIEAIEGYWRSIGWKNPGYHFIVTEHGEVVELQPLEMPSNGARGFNEDSIHVAYIGGKDEDDRTAEQRAAMRGIVAALKAVYKVPVMGHRDLPGVRKECPRFNAIDEYK